MKSDRHEMSLDHVPALLRDGARRLLERFEAACKKHDAGSLPPDRFPAVASVWAKSPYVAEYAIRHPEAFLSLVDDPGTATMRNGETFARIVDEALSGVADGAGVMRALRVVRNRELVRIAWRDLTGLADLDTVMQELSAFADAVLRGALAWAEAELQERFGRPERESGVPQHLLIVAMGKLGGVELNFSSDIDLIFVYPRGGRTRDGAREIDHQDYYDRLGKRLIALLNDVTEDGFVFRVDMRLRPFGDSGPLTTSFAALEHYYAIHGRDWERYALVKARAVTGARADIAVFTEITRPFVYRRYLDFGALEAVREMKALIDQEISSESLEDDIKRGAGGIREIEFVGQTFQLIRGGSEPSLRQRSILTTLAACATLGLMDRSDTDALREAYVFLRRTEHRLQQAHDRQTHRLPRDDEHRARLAYGMGFDDWNAFATALTRHRRAVQRCFAGFLMPAAGEAQEDASELGALAHFWLAAEEADGARELFARAGFDDPEATLNIARQLKQPAFLERISRNARERLARLMPMLIVEVGRRPAPTETFRRLADLIQTVARRSVYLALLADHPAALARMVDLYGASPWIAQQITRQPILLDMLIEPRALFSPPSRDELEQQLVALLSKHGQDDLEQDMEALRRFKHQQVLRVAASDVMDRFPVAEVSNQLTGIAEVVLRAALAIAWADLATRHGEPGCVDGAVRRPAGFAVIAYGKLGGLELGYGSDLDLVFIHDSRGQDEQTDGDRIVDNGVFFKRLAQRLIHLLSTTTAGGQAYEVDVRLRPSGRSGLLVTSLDAFAEYQRSSAWTWEHQALVRARGIAGSGSTLDGFAAVRKEVLSRVRNERQLQRDIVDMRERIRAELDKSKEDVFDIKHGAGGITDIEFMVQYGVLRWAAEHHELLRYTDNLRLLETFADLDLLPRALCRTLHDAYFAYRAELHGCALQQIDGIVAAEPFKDHREAVMDTWRRMFSNVTQQETGS